MVEAVKKDMTDFLEGAYANRRPSSIDLSVLNEAEKYNVNLSELETLSQKSEEIQDAEDAVKRQEEGWYTLDVKLSDIISTVFDDANYPIFIVQDDLLVYVNKTAQKLMNITSSASVLQHKFLEMVYKEDWNLLANNIGEMLTSHKVLKIRFNYKDGKIQELNLKAIYLSDIEHFSFILVGEKIQSKTTNNNGGLYDEVTGLPCFFLFEDRLQMAILAVREANKTVLANRVAVLAINIDNIKDLRKINFEDAAIKRLADNLVFNLPKTVTVSKGLKYHFWILLSNLKDEFELDYYLRRIKEVLDDGVNDNFMRHELKYSVGCSVFPDVSRTAKELIEHTITAVRKAQEDAGNSIVVRKRKE